jgi:hypothetical protein
MIVVANLHERCEGKSVGKPEIEELQAFSQFYIPQQLMSFLNGQ